MLKKNTLRAPSTSGPRAERHVLSDPERLSPNFAQSNMGGGQQHRPWGEGRAGRAALSPPSHEWKLWMQTDRRREEWDKRMLMDMAQAEDKTKK